MIVSTTVASTSCLLIAAEPVDNVSWTFSRIATWHASKTRKELRSALGATLRNKLSFVLPYLDASSAAAMFASLKDPNNKPVLCPHWPSVVQWQASQLATSALRITFEPEFTQWQIHTGPAPVAWTPTALAKQCALLWGRFEKNFEGAELDNAELFDAKITFMETGPEADPTAYAITPVGTVSTGPTINGVTPALFTFDHYYDKAKALGIDIEVQRSRLGNGRTEVETFHTQTPRRTCQFSAAGDQADMMRLAATFHSCAGPVKPLWFPSGYAPVRLAGNSLGSTVTVDSANNLNGHPYLVFRNGQTGADTVRTISSISGNTLTLNSAPVIADYTLYSTQLLLLGRFKGDELTVSFSWHSFSAKVDLVEVPADYSAPSGEVYGTSYGALDAKAQLFELLEVASGVMYRWTGYESAISYGGNVYSPKRITRGKIRRRLNGDDGTVQIKCDSWDGNPLQRLIIPRRGTQFTVTIKELNIVSGVAKTLWAGTARSAKASGRVLTLTPTGTGRMFEQRIPRQLMGPSCPWVIYDGKCGITYASKAKAGTLVSQVSTYVIRVQLAVAHAAHFFAGGMMVRTSPGGGSPSWAILDSTVSSANQVDITIDAPLSPVLVASEAVTLYPGCDCSFAACQAHGNTANFGGFPYMPAANPAFVAIKDTTPAGGKK
jgi:hypothetical protein